ncbi:MAG TPA: polyprenyl synthetase family protein [Dehalococcoidia bacterium]|nr:polyprenyl synthetase family protein [Dehalococcoidia bacterium]
MSEREPSFVTRYRPAILDAMYRAFDEATSDQPRLPLYDALRYHLGWLTEEGAPREGADGKLLRPALLLLSCEALGGDIERALPAAASAELIHNFTLLHDDIEDRSELRHGRPTVWWRWGDALAINAGDGLWAIARIAMHRLSAVGNHPARVLAAMDELDRACLALCEGQDRDIRSEGDATIGTDDYLATVRGKTAALTAACAAIGAILAGTGDGSVVAMREFGLHVGLAFQLRDDALGIWGSIGKAPAEDIHSRKLSYPVVYALARATPSDRARLVELYSEAPDDAGVDEAIRILERSGAREATEAAAHAAAERAVGALHGLALREPFAGELEALARYAVERTR